MQDRLGVGLGGACEIHIGNRTVGCGHPAYMIAELGSNHDGSLQRALALISAVAAAGADAVKFQSFSAQDLSRRGAPGYETLERLSIPDQWHSELRDACRESGIDFLSTPFDERRADLLCDIGVPAVKIASGDLTHHGLLRHVARLGLPLLLSTGLADLEEVRIAVEVLRDARASELALLHCVAAYPPRFEDLNLLALRTLALEFGTVVGLSDHSPAHPAVLAALPLGAVIFEKHVTFDRGLDGPDHAYALTVEEFAAMVCDVRRVELALGDGQKRPVEREREGRKLGRRSIHASCDLARGTTLEASLLKVVRPAEGVPPAAFPHLLGRRIARDLRWDEPITWEDLE